MTRINLVPLSELCNQHLFAEWREMPRLVGQLNSTLNRAKPFSISDIPPKYVLGKGHVTFFLDKFKFLHNRHIEITKELIIRGYNIRLDSDIFLQVANQWYNDYTPCRDEIEINKERIRSRMPLKPKWSTSNS